VQQKITVKTFDDVRDILAEHTPPSRSMVGNYTLDSMRAIMAVLGNPQDSYKVIHVAGTSGKTSTAYYIAALLRQTGKTVGLTVSPHVDQVNERLQINSVPLEESWYCSEFSEFMNTLNVLSNDNKLPKKPTYFELLVAFAYWEFARQQVDYAVVEVGLGGLLDGTNVITRSDKVSVITDIGMDHVDILGHTLGKIAAQKAGILLPGGTGFCLDQSDEVISSFKKVTAKRNSELRIIAYTPDHSVSHLPLFQQRNFFLASQVADYVIGRDALPTLTIEQLDKCSHILIPGRMEVVTNSKGVFILDAAHNPQKMEAFITSVRKEYPGQKFVVLFALLRSKDGKLQAVLEQLLPVTSHLIITEFIAGQDLHKHSTPPDRIVEACLAQGFDSVEVIADSNLAVKALYEYPKKFHIAVGTFYLLHQIHLSLGGSE